MPSGPVLSTLPPLILMHFGTQFNPFTKYAVAIIPCIVSKLLDLYLFTPNRYSLKFQSYFKMSLFAGYFTVQK